MNDLGNLLQMILDLLKSWAGSFSDYATAVLEKLNLIEEDTDNLSDIKSNTDDIKDNTGAIITPVQSIQSTNSTIATDTTSIKNTVTGMSNQLTTIATNVGTASAFAEDCANNTLDCSNRLVTIGSDTTQLRSNSNNITADVADIKTALNYYIGNTIVTEDSEGDICNFDTDLEDYLQKLKVTIPADLTGFSGITLTKYGKNILVLPFTFTPPDNVSDMFVIKSGVYRFSFTPTTATSWRLCIRLKDFNGNDLSDDAHKPQSGVGWRAVQNYWLSGANSSVTSYEINITEDCYIRIGFAFGDTDNSTVFNDCQLELGSVKTSYESVKKINNTISFGSTITDGAEIDLLSGIVKINSSPVTYTSITPIAVRTYKGVNNIYSDIGISSLTYRETLKHYLDKQE